MEYENIDIDIDIDVGIIVEKVYTVQLFYELLKSLSEVSNIIKSFHPRWGEDFVYFKYFGITYMIISAKGASIAINAVERVRRAHGKLITFIGTCGSTDSSIKDGSIIVPFAAVRDESASEGYIAKKIPALANMSWSRYLYEFAHMRNEDVLCGNAFTTDKRYMESPEELSYLYSTNDVKYVDMESSAIFAVAAYHHIKAAGLKVVTDCAVKESNGALKGIYDKGLHGDFLNFVNPILSEVFVWAIEASSKYLKMDV